VLGDAGKHSRTDLDIIVKSKYEVGPANTLKYPMRAAGLPLDAPTLPQ
jgi:hypothetical protein